MGVGVGVSGLCPFSHTRYRGFKRWWPNNLVRSVVNFAASRSETVLSEGVLFPREQPEKDATATPVRRGGTEKFGIGWCPHTLIWTLAGQFQTVPKLRELLAGKQAAATANVFCNESSLHNSEAGWTAKMTHTDDRSRKKEKEREREKRGKEARKDVAAR